VEAASEEGAEVRSDIHVSIRERDGKLEDVLADTAEKGHDMMFVGIEPTTSVGGGYSEYL